jgi:hypothetical protein
MDVCSRAFEGKHQPRQESSFYVFNGDQETIYSNATHRVKRVGKMRYYGNAEAIFLQTPDLINAGIFHDIALEFAITQQRMQPIAQPRFELVKRGEKRGVVFSKFDSALKEMIRLERQGGVTTIGQAVDEVLEQLATRSQTEE